MHDCTARLDGGDIHRIAHARPEPGDDLHRIFARAVKAGAEAYAVVLGQGDALDGRPQDLSLGREYKGATRGLRSELIARWRLRQFHRDGAGRPPGAD